VAADDFARTSASGFGSALVGGTWDHGSTAAYSSTDGSIASMLTVPGGSRMALLGTSGRDVEARVAFRVDQLPVGNSAWLYLVLRRTAGGDEMRARARLGSDGRVYLGVSSVVGGLETVLASEVETPGAVDPRRWVVLRARGTGAAPTTWSLRAWDATTTEPSDWQLMILDSTASLQGSGTVGIRAYLSRSATNSSFRFELDDYSVHAAAPTPAPGPDPAPTPDPTRGPTLGVFDRVVAPDGSDSAAGTAAAPWRTLQRAADAVPPGGTVWVRAGRYAGFTMSRSGSPGAPTTFRPWPGEAAVIDGALDGRATVVRFTQAHDVRLRGFTVTGAGGGPYLGAGIGTDTGAKRIEIIGNTVTGNSSFGVYLESSTAITVSGNDISHAGAGVYVSYGGEGTIISDNDVHDIDRMIRATVTPGNDDAGGDGIAFHRSTGQVLVTGNRVWRARAISPDYAWDGGGFSIYGASNVTFEGNVVWDSENILETGTDPGVPCEDNVFVRNVAYGDVSAGRMQGMFLRCATRMLVAQNTFVGLPWWVFLLGPDSSTYSGGSNGLRILDNIVDLHGTSAKVYGIVATLPAGVVIDGDLIRAGGTFATLPGGVVVPDLATFRTLTGYEEHGLTGDPRFIDSAGRDYRLTADSPAIDRALPIPGINDAFEGTGPDIGRYERQTP
jgi:parallel beta-helix repeat protein